MTCEHVQQLPSPAPEPPYPASCTDCTKLGESVWAHLRICLSCGHVACCDSSDGKHADKHYAHTDHPVMRSVESGEAWRWCYVDSRLG